MDDFDYISPSREETDEKQTSSSFFEDFSDDAYNPPSFSSIVDHDPTSGLVDFEAEEVFSSPVVMTKTHSPISDAPLSPAPSSSLESLQPPQEPENLIQKFEEKRMKEIEKNRSIYEGKRKEQIVQSKADVEKFYNQRRKETEERASRNRKISQDRTVEALSEPAAVWKNVREQIDLRSPTQTRDVSRMKRNNCFFITK